MSDRLEKHKKFLKETAEVDWIEVPISYDELNWFVSEVERLRKDWTEQCKYHRMEIERLEEENKRLQADIAVGQIKARYTPTEVLHMNQWKRKAAALDGVLPLIQEFFECAEPFWEDPWNDNSCNWCEQSVWFYPEDEEQDPVYKLELHAQDCLYRRLKEQVEALPEEE